MDPRALKYLADNQLEPCMNTTKWTELVREITSHTDFEPLVNIKHIYDTHNNESFSPVWWEEVAQEGFQFIEWIQIKSHGAGLAGTLEDATTDSTTFIKAGLDKHSIPYDYAQGIFTVYGYKRARKRSM